MRTIKFRALKDDMSNCRFYYGSLIYGKEGDPKIYDLDTDTYHTCIKGTEGQFTGLFDKNGKEIYEGDILKRFKKNGEPYKKLDIVEISIFGNDWAKYHDEKEIIGNIHETPELLN